VRGILLGDPGQAAWRNFGAIRPVLLQFVVALATSAAPTDTACPSIQASRRIQRFTLQAAPMK
jgi:hypothetical protein